MGKTMEKGAAMAMVNYSVQMEELVLSRELLLEAGIDLDDEVETICGDGEVIVRQRGLFDRLPDEVQGRLMAAGLSEEALEAALHVEAETAGGIQAMLENMESREF